MNNPMNKPMNEAMNEVELGRLIADVAVQVHQTIGGAGANLAVYRDALVYELGQRGLTVERRIIPAGNYNGVKLTRPKTIDLIVDDRVIVECKAVPKYKEVFEAEALADLRVTGLKLALIINFQETSLRTAIRRVVNVEG